MSILDFPIISRTRRNHGLEHATISLLSRRFPGQRLAGYSLPSGFFILGRVPTAELRQTVEAALGRMNAGESGLAIHPGCGTNYLASGLVAGLLAWLGMLGARDKKERLERLPLVLLLASVGIIASQPLGPLLQKKVTTSGEPAGMSVVDVTPVRLGGLSLHRVATRFPQG
jgi:hypothetical protein